MPPKQRVTKRRSDTSEELEAWTNQFLFGCDFLHKLEAYGVPTPPDQAVTEEAWRRLGAQFLLRWRRVGPERDIWVLREFGEPDAE